jgi:hypothetical protein
LEPDIRASLLLLVSLLHLSFTLAASLEKGAHDLTTMATEKRDEPTDLRIEDAEQHLKHLENVDLHDKALNASAREATAQEHSIGFIQGFKMYKRAAMWSFRECTPGQAFKS